MVMPTMVVNITVTPRPRCSGFASKKEAFITKENNPLGSIVDAMVTLRAAMEKQCKPGGGPSLPASTGHGAARLGFGSMEGPHPTRQG